MRRVLPLLVLLLAGTPARADADEHAFVELATSRASYVVGEPFPVVLRFGIDRAFFDEHAVPLFRQRMDVPVQVEAPWLKSLSGAARLDAGAAGDLRFALNGGAGRARRVADEVRDETTFEVYEVAASFQPRVVGEATLAATLRFAHATRFEEDFLGGRVAVDRRDAVVEAEPRTLRFRAIPSEGRPEAFDGAIGRFTVEASLAPATGDGGGSLSLTLVIEGEGNLVSFDAPGAECLPGFHVYGVIDDRASPRRTITYEIEPLSHGVSAVPAIELASYDATPPGRYRVVRTEPIPIAAPPRAPAPPIEGRSSPWGWVVAGLAVVIAAILLLFVRRRRKIASPVDDAAARRRARLEAAADPGEALADALASLLDVPRATVIGPDLAARLTVAGAGRELADRIARTLERLVSARFRADREASAMDREDLVSLVDELDAAMRATEDP